MGAFYEAINSPRHLNSNTRLKELVDETVGTRRRDFVNKRTLGETITVFCERNSAIDPTPVLNILHPFCCPAEVARVLRGLPNKSSSCLNGIPLIVLKHLPLRIIVNLTILFNNAINHSCFPGLWKNSKVLPVLKKGKCPTDPSSYRPISLTPSISKVFESVINNRLIAFCDDKKIIPDYQFGFRHRLSTTHAVHKFLSDVNFEVGTGRLVAAAFLDIEKAFDSVWLDGIVYRLHKRRFPQWLIMMVGDMITGRTFRTWDGAALSPEVFNVTEGLQQGTVNSPILFNIFLSELPSLFGFNDQRGSGLLSFADDVVVYATGCRVEPLQNKLDTLVDNINKNYGAWNLRLNRLKCETVLFRKLLTSCHRDRGLGLIVFKSRPQFLALLTRSLSPTLRWSNIWASIWIISCKGTPTSTSNWRRLVKPFELTGGCSTTNTSAIGLRSYYTFCWYDRS